MKILKAGRKFAVVESDEALVYLNTKSEAAAWIATVEKCRIDNAAFEAEAREIRRANVEAYLARRAARPSSFQLNLF